MPKAKSKARRSGLYKELLGPKPVRTGTQMDDSITQINVLAAQVNGDRFSVDIPHSVSSVEVRSALLIFRDILISHARSQPDISRIYLEKLGRGKGRSKHITQVWMLPAIYRPIDISKR